MCLEFYTINGIRLECVRNINLDGLRPVKVKSLPRCACFLIFSDRFDEKKTVKDGLKSSSCNLYILGSKSCECNLMRDIN